MQFDALQEQIASLFRASEEDHRIELAEALEELFALDPDRCLKESCPHVEDQIARLDVPWIRIVGRIVDEDVRWMAGCPSFVVIEIDSIEEFEQWSAQLPQSVFSLDLERQQLETKDLIRLVETERLSQIELLNLANNPIGLEGARALLEAGLPEVRILNLDNAFTVDEPSRLVELLIEAPPLNRLNDLHLDLWGMADEGAAILSRAENLPALKYLNLWDNGIRADGLEQLVHSSLFLGLDELVLHGNEVGREGARILSEAPICPKMTTLNLRFTYVTDQGVELLAQSASFPALEELLLEHCYLTDTSAETLASSNRLTKLQELDLSRNELTTEGMVALLKSTSLRELKTLNLAYTNVGDELLEQLDEVEEIPPELENLFLWGTNISEGMQEHLAEHDLFASLQDLDFEE